MIIYEKGKIVAISKNLLNTLNTDLSELSELINQIELEIAALNKNTIKIKNYSFKINKEEIITLKNLNVFHLEKEISENILPEEKPEETLSFLKTAEIKPETKEEETLPNILPEEKPEETLSFLQTAETKPETKEEETLPNILPEEKPEETIPNLIEEETPIELDFEESINECKQILSQKNLQDLIDKELQVAMEELGIDEEMAKELFEALLEQIKEKREPFYKAIENKDYNELHEIAHYLKGASLNLRLSNLSFIFKTIDEESKKHIDINIIKGLIDDFYDFISPLNKNNENSSDKEESIQIDPKIKAIVLNTIKQYLETQDERKFQKDKIFLEKLLNKKINSLEELKYLWKDEQ